MAQALLRPDQVQINIAISARKYCTSLKAFRIDVFIKDLRMRYRKSSFATRMVYQLFRSFSLL